MFHAAVRKIHPGKIETISDVEVDFEQFCSLVRFCLFDQST